MNTHDNRKLHKQYIVIGNKDGMDFSIQETDNWSQATEIREQMLVDGSNDAIITELVRIKIERADNKEK